MKSLAPGALLLLALAVVFWPTSEGKLPTPEPVGPIQITSADDGAATYRKTATIYARGSAKAARAHAARLRLAPDAGGYRNDLDGAKAWNEATGAIAKEAIEAATTRGKQLHADARKLDEHLRGEYLAKFFEEYAEGAEGR